MEFTGERVIPELVDADLLNEHLARYRFANRIAARAGSTPAVLDAGCGSGYGAAEFSCAGSVTAADISAAAIAHARERYGSNGVRFLQASCEALPFARGSFDVVVAFEVIEHLTRWQDLIAEANRVLKSSGVFLVSTPNRHYYAESRGDSGPNPFHCHEFDYEEFGAALKAVFPHVGIWTQNHAGAIAFSPQGMVGGEKPAVALVDRATEDTAGAHFFLAICSQLPVAADETFVWVPSSANVLQERERHIAKLSGELAQKDAWLREGVAEHGELQRKHDALLAELEQRNQWAAELNREIGARNARIVELQNEHAGRLTWIAEIESQLERARVEVARVNDELRQVREKAQGELDRLEAENRRVRLDSHAQSEALERTIIERTEWAQRLNSEVDAARLQIGELNARNAALEANVADLAGELDRIAASRWMIAGARLGLGPRKRDGK